MRVLIVEDEAPAQRELSRLLKKLRPQVQILALADSVEQAVQDINTHQPELILMDIQLADGQSFEIFSLTQVKAPVIFITAYDAFALDAFKANGIDYLLKPLEEEDLSRALTKYDNLTQAKPTTNNQNPFTGLTAEQVKALISLPGQGRYKTRFMVTLGDRIRFVPETDVAWFAAEDEVVSLVTREKKKYIISQTLESLEQNVNPALFFRIGRGMIVAQHSIKEIHKYFNSRLKLDLTPEPAMGEEVMVSRSRVQAFLQWMDGKN